VIQRVLEVEGKLTLLDQNRVIRPHPSFRLFATSNTVGLGDTTGLYHGTPRINQGQMDRWNIVATLNYLAQRMETGVVVAKMGDDPADTKRKKPVEGMVAPRELGRLLGGPPTGPDPEGSQLKVNMLLRRLPRLRDQGVDPRAAFAGTFHVAESYRQLADAHREASAGAVPSAAPSELYCHSLTDPSILGPELREQGYQTLTLFGLHLPGRLFTGPDHDTVRAAALTAVLAQLDAVLDEPLADCLATDADGRPCLEVRSPLDLERDLGLPGGNIFHRDLSFPFAEDRAEDPDGPDGGADRWGVATAHRNILLCGAGAVRGGGVSGIPGHNAAMAALGR